MTGPLLPGTGRRPVTAVLVTAVVVTAVLTAIVACGLSGAHRSHGTAPRPAPPAPRPASVVPLADYRAAVTAALADHLRVWIEADMVKRWEAGARSFRAAVTRVAVLANRPGVVGIKIADELGYRDGLDSAGTIRQFLSATAHALQEAVPGKKILVDMVVPQLGCLPGDQSPGSPAAACAAQALAAYPQLALPEIDVYLRMHAINVLDLSTGLLSDSTYAGWGTTAYGAQVAAWQEVRRLGWPGLVRLQSRKALAHPGAYAGTPAQAAADVHEFVDIPLASGAHAVDIWTWHQYYEGQMYSLMNPGMRPNALWDQLTQRRRAGDVLFTHMSPHSVEIGLYRDLAQIAVVFSDIFLPAGTG
jgi:hypothetical protein